MTFLLTKKDICREGERERERRAASKHSMEYGFVKKNCSLYT